MKQILNQLVQLQEFQFALAEQSAANPKADLAELRQTIEKLVAQLPPEVSVRYVAMQKRLPLVVAPLVRGGCSGCGLSVPLALVNTLRGDKAVDACPHCGRFIYLPGNAPLLRQRWSKDKGRPLLGIARFSAPELMLPRLQAKTPEDAITELAQLMAAQGFAEDAEALARGALGRETMISTAVEHGLAFPHVRNVEGGGVALALGLKPTGIKFGAPDGRLTKIVFFIVIPTASSAFYLKLLAGLVQAFSETEARNKLLDCETSAQMWMSLSKLTQQAIP